MKKLTLLVVAMLIGLAAQAWTIHFTNPENWETVNIYSWSGDGDSAVLFTGSWPGSTMTHTGDVWTYEYTGDLTGMPEHLIFNNGSGSQTSNLTFVANETYDMQGLASVPTVEYTAYYQNTHDWSEVYGYVYVDDQPVGASWPGQKLEADGNGLYVLNSSIHQGLTATVIFNNGSGEETGHFTLVNGATYDYEGNLADPTKTYTVYFDNAGKWDDVYVYTWQPEVATYPGVKLEADSNGLYVWNYESRTAPSFAGIQFNNGKSGDYLMQSLDFKFEEGKTYTYTHPERFFLMGTINGWNLDNPVVMTAVEGKPGDYSAVISDPGDDSGTILFRIFEDYETGGVQGNDRWNVLQYGAAQDDGDNISVNFGTKGAVTEDVVKGKGCWSFSKSELAGEDLTVNFHLNTMKVIFGKAQSVKDVETGVRVIEAADETPVYFNLQGVRIMNPDKGLYIRVVAGKAEKVIIR